MAKNIVYALGIDAKPEKDGFYRGRTHILLWMPEGFLNFTLLDDYGKSRLKKEDLPVIPEQFTLSVRRRKTQKGMMTDKSALRQMEAIREIFDSSDNIVIATGAGRKGETSFRRLYSYLDCNKPLSRLWLYTITADSIRKGFKNLRNISLYDNLFLAADCREKADSLVNTNISAAFGLATGILPCHMGRLEIPVLSMICKRYFEHRKTISTRFFEHYLTVKKNEIFRQFRTENCIKNRKKAEKIYNCLKTADTTKIVKNQVFNKIQPAPLLYNLTALQKDAFLRYGFSTQKTMEAAEKLYEEKLISCPRTDGRFIPESLLDSIPKLLRQTAHYCNLKDCLNIFDWENLNRNSVKATAVSLHHAIIPTGIYPVYMPTDQKIIYEMIVTRTLEAFAPDCEKQCSRLEAVAGNRKFYSLKSSVLSPFNWRSIMNREEDREKDETLEESHFTAFSENETLPVSSRCLVSHKTLSPPLYTEATLLEEMENASLGTAESRSVIIENLLNRNHIRRQGQFLLPDEMGLLIYSYTKDMCISDVETASQWEETLMKISSGEQDAETVLDGFKTFTRKAVDEILSINPSIKNKHIL